MARRNTHKAVHNHEEVHLSPEFTGSVHALPCGMLSRLMTGQNSENMSCFRQRVW